MPYAAENEFVALRKRARDRRDKYIAQARAEYAAALVTIAGLEQDLLGKVTAKHKSIAQCVDRVIPRDQPFSTLDVMTALEALDPGRVWRKRSLDYQLSRLRDKGIIRRLKRATIHEPALYVRSDSTAKPPAATGDKTLREVIRSVLTRPLTATEVTVAVAEAGYQSSMTKGHLRAHVAVELKKHFKRAGEKWTH